MEEIAGLLGLNFLFLPEKYSCKLMQNCAVSGDRMKEKEWRQRGCDLCKFDEAINPQLLNAQPGSSEP